ncbi:hypothetical protein DFH09DRAFT_1144611 [Mycena vulgaris]|nr:hypothetical protein DFH09DRAFT_1144611 [Mycena vulgaris]
MMLSARILFLSLALALGVLGAPIEQEERSVNSLNGGRPKPVWVERSVNSLNGGAVRPVWVKRSVNSLNGGSVRPVWVKRIDVNHANDGWAIPRAVEERSVDVADGWIIPREEERSVDIANGWVVPRAE